MIWYEQARSVKTHYRYTFTFSDFALKTPFPTEHQNIPTLLGLIFGKL